MIDIDPKDSRFWRYYLAVSFPFASDDATQTMLSDFMAENYDLPDEKWYRTLVGIDENGKETEPWDGSQVCFGLGEDVSFCVEFREDGNYYFLNDTYVGNSGGHFELSLISWQELTAISVKPHTRLLLLPLVVGNSWQRDEISTAITDMLTALPIGLKEKDIPTVTDYLTDHLIFGQDDTIVEDPELGTICTRNHSRRNPAGVGNSKEEIREINRIMRIACL